MLDVIPDICLAVHKLHSQENNEHLVRHSELRPELVAGCASPSAMISIPHARQEESSIIINNLTFKDVNAMPLKFTHAVHQLQSTYGCNVCTCMS